MLHTWETIRVIIFTNLQGQLLQSVHIKETDAVLNCLEDLYTCIGVCIEDSVCINKTG